MTAQNSPGAPPGHAPRAEGGQQRAPTLWLGLSVALMTGLALVLLLFLHGAPAVIERAYHGDSLPGLNNLFAGRDAHTLEHYQDHAVRAFAAALPALVAAAVVFFCLAAPLPRMLPFVLLGALGLGLRIAIASTDPRSLVFWPMGDDAHYYFNIAYNLCHGHGLRHDALHLTTGFQPLFLLVILPVYVLVADKTLAIQAVLMLTSFIGLVYGGILSRLAYRCMGRAAALFVIGLWAVSPAFVEVDLNGQETCVSLLLLALGAWGYQRWYADLAVRHLRHDVLMGLLLGLAFLARVDNALMAVVLAADLFWRSARQRAIPSAMKRLVVMAATALLVASPWLALNLHLSNSIMPSSGQAVRFLSLAFGTAFVQGGPMQVPAFAPDAPPLAYYVNTAACAGRTLIDLFRSGLPLGYAALILVAAVVLDRRQFAAAWRPVAWLAPYCLGIFMAYVGYIFGQWFFLRYLAPFLLLYLLILAAACSAVSRWAVARRAGRAWGPLLSGVAAAVLVFQTVGGITDRVRHQSISHVHQAVDWMNANLPPDAVVGAFQSGILAYYLNRPIIALDGKVNLGSLNALRNKTMDLYIQQMGIRYLADDDFVFRPLCQRRSRDPRFLAKQSILHAQPNERSGGFTIYEIAPGPVGLPGSTTP